MPPAALVSSTPLMPIRQNKCNPRHTVPFVVVNTALHDRDRDIRHFSDHEIPGMTFRTCDRKVRNSRIGKIDAICKLVGKCAQP